MDPLTQLRADDVVDVLVAAQESMLAHAPALDRLDRLDQLEGIDGGDTGTHLAATLGAVVAGLTPGVTLTQLATDLQSVAASAGVGRSGRMLAAFLGGFAELCRNAEALDPVRWAMAFEAGSDAIERAAEKVSRSAAEPSARRHATETARATIQGRSCGMSTARGVRTVAPTGRLGDDDDGDAAERVCAAPVVTAVAPQCAAYASGATVAATKPE